MSYISKNDAYKISRVTSLPSTGDLGTLYLNTTTNTLWMYDGVNGWFTRLMFDDFVYDYYARYSDIPVGSYSNLTRKIIVLNDETDGGITNSYESVSGNLQKVLGKSAYQVAVDNGFSGSQNDWLASLHGEIGESLGVYNVSTNTPTLVAIPSSSFSNGDYYDVTVSGSIGFNGLNFTSGSLINVGDQIKKLNSQWYVKKLDVEGAYNVISQRYFLDTKPTVIPVGTSLGTPNSLTCHIAPAGTYILPSGSLNVSGNINLFFWDFTSGCVDRTFKPL